MQDARVPLQRLQSMYTEMILLMRKLYQECRLVHGDLSEYNILVDQVPCSCLIHLLSPSLTPILALQNVLYIIHSRHSLLLLLWAASCFLLSYPCQIFVRY